MKTSDKICTLKQFLIENNAWELFLRNMEWESYEELDRNVFDDEMLEDGVDIHFPKEGSREFWQGLNREWKGFLNHNIFDDPDAVSHRYGIDQDKNDIE